MVNIVKPRVTLIAQTHLQAVPGGTTAVEEWMTPDIHATDAETVTEFGGRNCYQSFNRPNPKTAYVGDYLERTIFDQGHGSIAEHASATLYFTGVSRAWLAEITRHRHLSFSVQSQRFVNEGDCNVVMPPAIRNSEYPPNISTWKIDMERALSYYRYYAADLQGDGLPRKKAREAARSVLPNAVETRAVVTGNLRAWTDVLYRRLDPAADAEMQESMRLALEALKPVAPHIFEHIENDMKEKRIA